MVTVGAALGLKLLLVPLVERDTPFLLFSGAVLVAAWYGGLGPGLAATALAALASSYFFIVPFYRLEIASPAERFRLAVFLVEGTFISVLGAALHAAKRRAEHNARESHALRRQVLDVSEREMRRIGRDLHDGLGQLLTGTAFMAKALSGQLSERSPGDAEGVRQIERHVNQAVRWTRDLAAALAPVSVEARGLGPALRELAAGASEMFDVRCEFDDDSGAFDPGNGADAGGRTFASAPVTTSQAIQLYRIAQEAVSNAVRHGRAKGVRVRVERDGNSRMRMVVEDDGVGFDTGPHAGTTGMGVRTMSDRARIIGGTLQFTRSAAGGTAVVCTWPAGTSPDASAEASHE